MYIISLDLSSVRDDNHEQLIIELISSYCSLVYKLSLHSLNLIRLFGIPL